METLKSLVTQALQHILQTEGDFSKSDKFVEWYLSKIFSFEIVVKTNKTGRTVSFVYDMEVIEVVF